VRAAERTARDGALFDARTLNRSASTRHPDQQAEP
jgi:hypothetical protein